MNNPTSIVAFSLLLATAPLGPANANNKLKLEVQAAYIAAKACQKRVGGFNKQLSELKQRRGRAAKKYPPLLSEKNSSAGSVSLVVFHARVNYMQFQYIPRSDWKEYCRLGLGKALRRTRTLK